MALRGADSTRTAMWYSNVERRVQVNTQNSPAPPPLSPIVKVGNDNPLSYALPVFLPLLMTRMTDSSPVLICTEPPSSLLCFIPT